MEQRFFGFFSGFPSQRFPQEVARRLREALSPRESLVFISAWPEDHQRNDSDLNGMYQMFLEWGMNFQERRVIDSRAKAPEAQAAVRGASCVFLMGGHPGLQWKLIQDLGLDGAIQKSDSAVLGVSAGAINMAARSLDTKESPVPYAGLGLADITVKPHFDPGHQGVLSLLLKISMELPICAMEDNSAIFVQGDAVSWVGQVHWVYQGVCREFSPEKLAFARITPPSAGKN
ncbi:MAG: type 1 glutamine amidotransferase-like domain-containing protein [Acutalibacter sp.]|nr:type 1 glutamine amidotransferase-like domain-containing protein [Acutalibacter sp.]